VEITPKARSIFNRELQLKIRDVLVNHFQDNRFDEGLQAAIKMIRERLAAAR
jgi:hypothetical protein